uniref:Transmembrane protein 168 n=1 Tax=Phallusia mammillata TaxID=59560 RepID=A0A6F9DVL7_9ASCI|nr:transmembrane protein 168-A-like [Phallusia mammillata]
MTTVKLQDKIRYLKTLPGLLLVVALSVVLSNLWLYEASTVTLSIAAAFIVLSLVTIYLEYCFASNSGYSLLVSYFWWSVLLSLLTFGREWYRTWWYDDRDRLADMLIMTSTAIKCCCDFLDRFCKNVTYSSMFLSSTEVLSLLAFVLGGTFFLNLYTNIELLVIVIASAIAIINLRMKCMLAFAYVLLFIIISGISVFDNFPTSLNPYALVSFHVRLFVIPVVDFYFSPLSAVERWSCSFKLGRCMQFVALSTIFLVEAGFCALAFYVVRLHPEYELVVVVPVVGVSGVFWLCMHSAYFATEVLLSRKFAECNEFMHKLPSSASGTSLSHIMSSRGVRQICLIGQQTVACAFLTTLMFGAVCWRREEALYPAVLLVVLGIESCSYGRTRELAVKLGGTCAAYALITPTTVVNPNTPVTVLPAGSLEKQNNRATSLITALHRFFALYLIENLGCDYVTSGIAPSTAEKRLTDLFARKVKDSSDARYDTYLFYYSGLTNEDGSLVLGDGAALTPDHVIEMWRDSCCLDNRPTNSRLLLIFDIVTSQPWIKTVSNLQYDYVAIQTCRLTSSAGDVESMVGNLPPEPGVFTSEWVQWNCDVTNGLSEALSAWQTSDDTNHVIRPIYMTSRRWTDFALKVPLNDERNSLAKHWGSHYPTVCRPCLSLSATCAARLRLVRLLGAPGRRYRRLKMRWLPPETLDTGHGFRLVRS